MSKNWPLANVIQILLEGNELDNTFIDGLMRIMQKFVDTTKDEEKKKMMQESLLMIQKMKEKEQQEKMMEEEDLKKLEELINEVK